MSKKIIVGICGASGIIYGLRLLQALMEKPVRISLIISEVGKLVMRHETDCDPEDPLGYIGRKIAGIHPQARLSLHGAGDLFAPPASGSFRHDGMVIAPCSMKTLAAISAGIAETVIHRAADVCLKEKRPLILVPRETPLNLIHLENMCRVSRAGATVMPAMPSFYSNPGSIPELVDTVVARILDHLGIPHDLAAEWGAHDQETGI
ncbi:MAG: UbiX family flavin prenyltransferase [Thermodesulfobacteriota bacterium]